MQNDVAVQSAHDDLGFLPSNHLQQLDDTPVEDDQEAVRTGLETSPPPINNLPQVNQADHLTETGHIQTAPTRLNDTPPPPAINNFQQVDPAIHLTGTGFMQIVPAGFNFMPAVHDLQDVAQSDQDGRVEAQGRLVAENREQAHENKDDTILHSFLKLHFQSQIGCET